MPPDLRKQLESSAADRNGGGWTLTQELLHRLQRSLDRERDEKRDPAARALCYLLAEIISFVAVETGHGGELVTNRVTGDAKIIPNSNWRSDPFTFHAVRLAFDLILDALQPAGEMQPPGNPNRGEIHILGERFPIPAHTPEDLARSVRDYLLFRLAREPREFHEAVRGQREWAMSQAAQALRLKQGTKS
jgi:hypothetical protein